MAWTRIVRSGKPRVREDPKYPGYMIAEMDHQAEIRPILVHIGCTTEKLYWTSFSASLASVNLTSILALDWGPTRPRPRRS